MTHLFIRHEYDVSDAVIGKYELMLAGTYSAMPSSSEITLPLCCMSRIPPQKDSLQVLLFETNLKRYRAPAKSPGISKAVLDLKLVEPSFSLKQIKWRKRKKKGKKK